MVIGGALAIVLLSYATLRASVTPDDLIWAAREHGAHRHAGPHAARVLAGGAVMDATSGAGALAMKAWRL